MVIHNFYYNEDNRTLSIEFSTEHDGEEFYRNLKLELDEIIYYSPTIIDEIDLFDIEEDFIIDLVDEFLKENDLPDQLTL